MTSTFATLELSELAYAEISKKLRDAGYHHAIYNDGGMDMSGIRLVPNDIVFEDPRRYQIAVYHHSDGKVVTHIFGVAKDEASIEAAVFALRAAADVVRDTEMVELPL